jgi:sugar phosphate isomerase/epimerase
VRALVISFSAVLTAMPVCYGQQRETASVSPAQTFPDSDSIESWTFSNGPEWPGARGALTWRADAGRAGEGALALAYNFEQGGRYVAAISKLPETPEVKAVRFWLHKPTANPMVFRAVDADGETFQKNVRYHYPGWQQLEIGLANWEHHWGGDGVFRVPPREFHILVENEGGNRVGTLLIDDVQWVYRPKPPRQMGARRIGYLESDFTDAQRWRYRGAEGGGFAAAEWHYDFTSSESKTHLVRDRSILGRPQGMRLIVESDGSGHELIARVGSHFQDFERSLGTLDETGQVSFEAPLGDMTTWRHFGGENDGVVRYPLRLIALTLAKKGDRETGTIGPLQLRFDTEYQHDTELIWLMPTATYADADAVRFKVELRGLTARPIRGELHWSLHSADRQLRQCVQDVEVPPRGRPTSVEMVTDWSGSNVLEARFQFRGKGIKSREVSTTIARVPPGEPDTALDPASRIGAGLYLYRFHGEPDAPAAMERVCDLAARAGVKWTREEFHWRWIEPRRGEYDFAFFDQLVETARSHGISIYALCCYWTDWTTPYSDEGIEDYCRYLETLVRHYGDRIKHWEIWNEPNAFFWSGPKELYVELLRRAYETIKAIDPEAEVLGCSTVGIDTSFIQMVLDADGPFDALTVHPYRGMLDPQVFINELRSAHQLVGGRDVWITEMGWPSHIGGLTEREQAGYVARTYISALAAGVARSVAWYDFREDGVDPFYNEHHFGLVRRDLTPKMGYRALATVGQLLGSAEFEKELSLPSRLPPEGDRLVGYLFRRGPQQVAALWSPGRTRMATFKLAGENLRALNAVGEPMPGLREGYLITVLERDMPAYILADGELGLEWKEFPLAIRLDQPAVHPGEPVTYETYLDAMTRFDVDELPPGWKSGHVAGPGSPITIMIPADAVPGRYTVTHNVETIMGAMTFTLPVEIEVVPLLLRR